MVKPYISRMTSSELFAVMVGGLASVAGSILAGYVALCGFANLSSIAILIGGLGGMAPNRRSEIARLGLPTVAAGTFSNLTSAAIVGLFVG